MARTLEPDIDAVAHTQANATGAEAPHLNGAGAISVSTLSQIEAPPSRTKVIKFSNVSKRFTLHHERARSFQDLVVSLFGLTHPFKARRTDASALQGSILGAT